MRRALRWCVLLAVLVVLPAPSAAAHPLGLPAFAQVVASDRAEVTVRWNAAPDDVAALARAVGLPADRVLTREQDAALAGSAQLLARVRDELQVRQDGTACPGRLVPVSSVVTAGITVRFTCPAPVDQVRLRLALLHDVDGRYRTLAAIAGRTGVERRMFTSAQPEQTVSVDPAQAGALPVPAARSNDDVRGAFGGALPWERRFVTALDGSTSLLGFGLSLLLAFAVGAVHALAPGHGKTVAAAYLVGDRGRPRDAVVLGSTVALMHTGSVVALGLALWSATRQPDAARLTDAINLAAGVSLTAIGSWLLVRRLREPAADHGHPHEVPAKPLSREGLVALGAAGGLLPSPSALLLLLTALAVGRLGLGLLLIAAFSAGLAVTLTLVGLLALRGRDLAHGRGGRLHQLAHRAPVVGAGAVAVLGAWLVVRTLV